MTKNIISTPKAATITGRDGYITVKALVYAVACLQSLPDDRAEYSDMADMCEILHASDLPESLLDMILLSVEHHIQRDVDLFPSEGMDDERQAMRTRINAIKVAREEALRGYNKAELGGNAA